MADLVVAAAACWLLGLLSISAIFCHCEKGAETLNEGGNVDIVFHSLVFQYGLHQHLRLTVLQGRSGVVKLMDGLVRHEDDLDPVVVLRRRAWSWRWSSASHCTDPVWDSGAFQE